MTSMSLINVMFIERMSFNLKLLMKKYILRLVFELIVEHSNFYNFSAKTIIFKVKILLESSLGQSISNVILSELQLSKSAIFLSP